ncbi:Thioredoxin-like protein [Lachnellula hyalina]|uniref:Thioredoxin-like protein n=1 Tax=Lachnellula hyalina TaxID=1316788 RepID=A0A8H8QZM7_9HELO|nr:Thioredoxin-like protein [Lachnellula hyalina]TVY24996.1 Thioredoxin-like protein [Lachnellula hyalina]
MSKTLQIASPAQFSALLKSSRIVVTDFYADWCGPCKAIAPIYEQLSAQLSRPNQISFTKVNVDTQKEIASKYAVTAMPTFMIFKQGEVMEKVQGADPRKLQDVVRKLAAEADPHSSSSGFGGSSSSSGWRVGELPRGYHDVTDQIDVKGLELLNADIEFGGVRGLFEDSKPSGLLKGKAAEKPAKDWVESDTDEQLMLFLPFQSTLKVHTLQITSLPPSAEDDEEVPMRPKTIQIYPNRPHILGFEEADDVPAAQSLTIAPEDWDSTGTATLSLRFVKFQNVTSLVLFVVDGNGEGERVRLDRVRIIGETGEKRDQGKLEKVDHDH